MSAEMVPLDLARLLDWIVRERASRGTVFGLHQDLFRLDLRQRAIGLVRRGHRLETPIGAAAGPHTQLSQNLVAAWLCGARFLELKTVQVRDELTIPRPCIDMRDVGYNCEWSQELPIEVSAAQYLDAWVAIRALQQEAGCLEPDEPGFVMDLSVGYDLAGITSAKVGRFIDRLTVDARGEIADRLAVAERFFEGSAAIPVPDRIADSVTISTMHGCPPEEIERIARHLLEDRGLDTTVKLNPTLLGADEVRGLLNDALGYPIEVPDAAFADDLQWDAALDLIRALTASARGAGRHFGVKLTNTLACKNDGSTLPESETVQYLSGRALHPIAVRTAARLQEAHEGALDISFAGGADARNVASLVAAGLAPVTVCSDLLRPGGYQRLLQYLEALEARAADLDATGDAATLALGNLERYAREVVDHEAYRYETHAGRTVKSARALAAFDCIAAPCVLACPTGQDIPEYCQRTALGDPEQALSVVLRDNPLPTVSGMVCDHPCVERCTRVNYDEPVRIRDVKRTLAHTASEPARPPAPPESDCRAAVVGAGPAGLACAWYLAQHGVRTAIYEAKERAGGMITDAIPSFRLTDEDFALDRRRLEAAGVEIHTGERVDRERLAALRRDCDVVMLALGEQRDQPLGIPGEDTAGVWPALRFLSAARRGTLPAFGEQVVVIGGGNTAMDAARTAVRLVPPRGTVQVVYRRTVAEMPAAREELRAIRDEGVALRELLSPVEVTRRGSRLALVCAGMRLGVPDASGRPRPEVVPGQRETIECDVVVTAVGQALDGDLLDAERRPASADTPLDGEGLVFVGGDALRGAATLVEALGDGRRAALAALARLGIPHAAATERAPRALDDAGWQERAARLQPALHPPQRNATGQGDFELVIGELSPAEARVEAARCLDCSERCDVCVSVCPNRANLVYESQPRRWALVRIEPHEGGPRLVPDGEFVLEQTRQTCNLVDWCNECGNCTTFCPTAGEPYRDKPRLALQPSSGDDRGPVCHLERRGDAVTIVRRAEGCEERLTGRDGTFLYETATASVVLDKVTFAVRDVQVHTALDEPLSLGRAAALAVLLDGLADHPLVAVEEE